MAPERDAALAERDRLAEQNDRLRHLLRQLQRMQFGRRSEKLDPDQLQLAFEDLEQAVARGTAEAEKREPQLALQGAARRRESGPSLPPHLRLGEILLGCNRRYLAFLSALDDLSAGCGLWVD